MKRILIPKDNTIEVLRQRMELTIGATTMKFDDQNMVVQYKDTVAVEVELAEYQESLYLAFGDDATAFVMYSVCKDSYFVSLRWEDSLTEFTFRLFQPIGNDLVVRFRLNDKQDHWLVSVEPFDGVGEDRGALLRFVA